MESLGDLILQYKIFFQVGIVCFFLLAPLFLPSRNKLGFYFKNWIPNLSLAAINIGLFIVLFGDPLRGPNSFFFGPQFGLLHQVSLSPILEACLGFLFIDLVIYFWHKLNHEWDWLWYFHATHHSDQKMDASSAYRFHFIEVGLSFFPKGIFYILLGIDFPTVVFYEVFYNTFNLFVHSDIRMNRSVEKALSYIFITPRIHQIHHSIEMSLHNSNYGTIFSIWDRIFNSFSPLEYSKNLVLGVCHIPHSINPLNILLIPYSYPKKLKARVNKEPKT